MNTFIVMLYQCTPCTSNIYIYICNYLLDARVRGLTAAWARHDFELANALLANRENFGLPEILKALELLDAGRQVRILEKRMKMLQVSKNKVKPKTIGKLKSDIDNLNAKKSPVSFLQNSLR